MSENNGRPDPYHKLPVPTFEVAKAYLASKHITMWPSVSWTIKRSTGLEDAAAWITKLVDDINAVRNIAENSTMTVEEAAVDYRNMMESPLVMDREKRGTEIADD
jgi:hypothetical protein